MSDLRFIGETLLSAKTGARIATTYINFCKSGIRSPSFLLSATSATFSGAALVVCLTARYSGLTTHTYLTGPLTLVSSGLGTISDALDKSLSLCSPVT